MGVVRPCRAATQRIIALVLMAGPLFADPKQPEQKPPLVLSRVTVIDVAAAAARPDMTVVISGDRIVAVGRTGELTAPSGAVIVDAPDKLLIPGLWDMHVHWYDKAYLPLFIANGVTGIRQMYGSPLLLQWREELADGSLAGPRMVLAGPIVDGPQPTWPGSIAAGTPAEGRQAVQRIRREGYDFVKVYHSLTREAYFAIAAEAKAASLPFVGHVPGSVTAAEGSDAGQKSIEHLTGILLGCSSREDELRREMLEQRKGGPIDPVLFQQGVQKCLDSYDGQKAAALFARFAANGTWQVPTLTTARALANLDDAEFRSDPRLKYMPVSLRERWNPANDFRFKHLTPESYASQRAVFGKRLEIVRAMHRAGVGLLAGTDVINPYCFPGFSLHDELELLVQAGLTPAQALQTATCNPAQFLDRQPDFGAIEPGRLADLVLLDADPLADIRNTRRIAAVILCGRLLNRDALKKMLADVETLAAGKP